MSEPHNTMPLRTYYLVFVALMALLVATVAAAEIEHATINAVLAVTIAVAKAVLIMVFFMHLKYSSGLIRVFAVSGFLFLAILLVLMINDYIARVAA